MDRTKKIVRTSLVGIAVNLVLVAFKMAVGLIAGSIAVILDAVNNLSDALSSGITIVGAKLAGRAPDKKHPYGYGRVEYLTSVAVAVIVLLAGVTSLRESVEKIINPAEADYSVTSLIIIAVAVAAKLLCGRYVKGVGKQINSGALIASGSDALFDAVLSTATLLAAAISLIWHITLEGPIGALISLFILKAGVEMLLETLNSIIGTRADPELTEKLKEYIGGVPRVRGVYDLTLHNYGPTQIIASAHIEVADGLTARQIHPLTRSIAAGVFGEFGIVLTVGVYAACDDPEFAPIKEEATRIAAARPEILQMHGFYGDPDTKRVMFDLIVDFKADAPALRQQVTEELTARYPAYQFDVVLDSDYSDL